MLKVEVLDKNSYYYLSLVGEVDYNFEEDIKHKIEEIIIRPKDTVVSLEKVTYIDSVGITVMMYLMKNLAEKGNRMFFLKPDDAIRKVFAMTRLDKIIPVIEREEDINK